ncbi:uncharacterized protein N7503_006479 [Penicillium pulvis]|uniref:uncharacterized protein n=1 Tax=Penicillium pulvis TaxID=1562058 RepID=UPI002547075B|nr:uncharacterized protein N7503_006479 [Penicillium pulvis]KAJ5798974.1 hypothetical protein N7503_006479 [Penicillium pulvis]
MVFRHLNEQYSALSVDVCGTEDGSPAAWIRVNHTGEVTFFNKNGNSSTCVLNQGLKAGSWCTANESEVFTTKFFSSSALSTADSITNTSLSATATPSTATPSTATPSTATPSIATPSTATPSTATPSTATPSTATPSTATPSTATPSTATPSTATPSTATTQNELNTVLCHVIVYPSSTMTTSCSSL